MKSHLMKADISWGVTPHLMSQSYEVAGYLHGSGEYGAVLLPIAVQTLTAEDQGMTLPVAMRLTKESMQGLFDEMWAQGFRPKSWVESAPAPTTAPTSSTYEEHLKGEINALTKELAAVRDHLSDMRAIANSFADLKK